MLHVWHTLVSTQSAATTLTAKHTTAQHSAAQRIDSKMHILRVDAQDRAKAGHDAAEI